MRANKLFKKERGKYGEGRATIFKPINLPVELIDELKVYRAAYESVLAPMDENGCRRPMRVSYEQMIRRWMDNVGRFDADVKAEFLAIKEGSRKDNEKNAEQNEHSPLAPTQENLWEMAYKVQDAQRISVPVCVGYDGHFWAEFDGLEVPLREVLAHEGWTLVNETGTMIERDDVDRVERIIREHLKIEQKADGNIGTKAWFVRADGKRFEVRQGKDGREDFAVNAIEGFTFASESRMLAAGFIRVEVPLK